MENKDKNIINNTYGNINPSSAAISAVPSLWEQINTATDHQASSGNLFDVQFDDDEDFDLLDMFCNQDFYFRTTSTIFDVIGEPSSVMLPQALQPDQPELLLPAPALGLKPEVNVNTPEDFSMISSSSNETATQNQATKQLGQGGEEEKVNDKKKKPPIKRNNTSTKNPTLPRFAFVTKSETDVMDDGYEWRKYGQKAVKKSPFARSYYRCTGAECGVVKRVERSSGDPSTVVTTYVGNHNHILPIIAPRGSKGMSSKSCGFPGVGIGAGGCIGGSSGEIVSFGSGSGSRFINGTGNASGCNCGRLSSSSGGGGFTYGLGGSNFISGIGGASGGGRFSSSIGSSSKGKIVDSVSGSGMIIDNAYHSGAIRSSIGSHAIVGGDLNGYGGSAISAGAGAGAGASDMSFPNYTIEQQASYQQHWQQHQHQPYLHRSPALSSYTFGPANVVVSAATAASTQAAAAAAPTNTTTSSAAIGSRIQSFENNGFYALMEMNEELGMRREQGLLQDMLTPQMQQPRKRGRE